MVKHQEAFEIIDNMQLNYQIIEIDTVNSLGYTLAANYSSEINIPPFKKSAMDGYALHKDDNLSMPFKIIDTIYAGCKQKPLVKNGECIKVMTGAPVPENLDLVIMKELAIEKDGFVSFNIPQTKLNANLCQIGEDIAQNQIVGTKNQIITPTLISSLISVGIFKVQVIQKPKILFISTGDEIVSTAQKLAYGQIYNSNAAYIQSRLFELGFTSETLHIEDSIEKIERALTSSYDFIITTGAISVGEKDIFRKFIKTNNCNVLFDRVNIAPGSPCCLWEYNNIPILSLAGSPFANFVTFELFARRILANFTCDKTLLIKKQQALLTGEYTKSIKRHRFIKAKLEVNKVSLPASNHNASSMHEMILCNAVISLPKGNYNLKPNDEVIVFDLRRYYE